jgi:hypothetical protein
LQEHSVKVLVSLNDALRRTFTDEGDSSSHEFKSAFWQIKTWLAEHTFDGVELTIGQALSAGRNNTHCGSQCGVRERLHNNRTTATHLAGAPEWSKIDCKLLEASVWEHIAWYNVQFFSRNDILFDISEYQAVISNNWPAEKVVVRICAGFGCEPPSISVLH